MGLFSSRHHLGAPMALAVALGALSLLSAPAHAVVTGGAITDYGNASSIFQKLSIPFDAPATSAVDDSTVGQNTFQTPNLYAFDEEQNIFLTTPLSFDVGPAGAGQVSANQYVASHYVFFDPAGTLRIQGYVDFDAPIIGVATSKDNLDASDILLNNLVTYLSPSLRGLEANDSVWIDSASSSRLRVDFTASSPGDYVRVFTQFSPTAAIPLPATAPLLAAAMCWFGLISWRRNKTG
ncbi:MAG: hypothetical protein CL534_19070 [Ahrensia sp.]|nr:hypothetical protein [Ahrensia sp.]